MQADKRARQTRRATNQRAREDNQRQSRPHEQEATEHPAEPLALEPSLHQLLPDADLDTTVEIMLGVTARMSAPLARVHGLEDPWMVDPPGAAGPAAGAEPPLHPSNPFTMSCCFPPRPLCAYWRVGNCLIGRNCPDRHDVLLTHQRLIAFIDGAEVSLDICVHLITHPQVSTPLSYYPVIIPLIVPFFIIF